MSDKQTSESTITLSRMSEALLETLAQRKKRPAPLEGERYEVSQTVSLFGFMYEKVRNAVEFSEEHLIRRMATARILRRRLAINPEGKGEGENLIRELMWGRYISSDNVTQSDVKLTQKIIDAYLHFAREIKRTHKISNSSTLEQNIIDLMSSEVEEALNSYEAEKHAAYVYFFYQTLKNKVEIQEVDEDTKDTYFYAAAEKAFLKNDAAFIRYHLFTLRIGSLQELSQDQITKVATQYHDFAHETEKVISNAYSEKLVKFASKQVPPFKILYDVIERLDKPSSLLTKRDSLKQLVNEVCSEKYLLTGKRLQAAAVRSIIYIFVTKMVFVILLELPLSQIIFNEIHLTPLAINTLFPPLLMGVIVTFINPPSKRNTQRIFNRVVDILNRDPSFETSKTTFTAQSRTRRPTLVFVFSILYIVTFTITFGSLYALLEFLEFNILSKLIFFFFVSVVAFFGYRIRQTAKEYVLEERPNPIAPLITFLFLPILYVGKFLSNEIARFNLFILFFDTLIEAPFKLFIEIFEEWTRFVKARKEEII